MAKLDVDLIYKAIDELDLPDDAEVRRVVDYAIRMAEQEKEEKEPSKKQKKQYLIVTTAPLSEPILGWIIQKEPETSGMRNETGEYEEGIAPTGWGDLEVGQRLLDAAKEVNSDDRLRKRAKGRLACAGDIMEHAPKKTLKEHGIIVTAKEPVAIVPVGSEMKQLEIEEELITNI